MIEKKKNDETYERKEIIKERMLHRGLQLYFVLIMKSHLQSYPCPLQLELISNVNRRSSTARKENGIEDIIIRNERKQVIKDRK